MWEVLGTAGDCEGAHERDATGIRAPPSPGSDGWKICGNSCGSQSCRLCRSLGQRNASPSLSGRYFNPAWTDLCPECSEYHSTLSTTACSYFFLHLHPV